jgi:hypothetical protein
MFDLITIVWPSCGPVLVEYSTDGSHFQLWFDDCCDPLQSDAACEAFLWGEDCCRPIPTGWKLQSPEDLLQLLRHRCGSSR